MRTTGLLLTLGLGLVPACAMAAELPVTVGGRVVTASAVAAGQTGDQKQIGNDQAPVHYTYAWPGVYFTARFTGDQVSVHTDDDQNKLDLLIDGQQKLILTKPGKTTVTLDHLGPGAHTIRLEKTTETQASSGSFDGFTVPDAANVLPAPTYEHRIEFIGDSYTVGYGADSQGQMCTREEIAETTDTSHAFGPLTAKYFHAAYRINAYSGEGIARNYDGSRPKKTLPYFYKYALYDDATEANDDGWTPEVVVIGLGTNDFSTPLTPGEKWDSRVALGTNFINRYVKFVKHLHKKWPKAHFILMADKDGTGERIDNTRPVYKKLKEDDIPVELLPFGGLTYRACDGHPSAADHITLSKLLISRISLLPGFAGAGTPADAAQK